MSLSFQSIEMELSSNTEDGIIEYRVQVARSSIASTSKTSCIAPPSHRDVDSTRKAYFRYVMVSVVNSDWDDWPVVGR